jgi:hypothetical protein
MSETKCFCYTFSKETTKQILEGDAYLSTGGAKGSDGKMIEFGKPLLLDKDILRDLPQSKGDDISILSELLRVKNKNIDLSIDKIEELQKTIWLNYAVSSKTLGITIEGFSQTLMGLDNILEELHSIKHIIVNKYTNDYLELLTRYRNNLNSDAGIMETKRFDATNTYSMIVTHLDEISAFIDRISQELQKDTINGLLACNIIFGLLGPYSYVVKKYSVLYYYENNCFPPNLDTWIKTIDNISKSKRFAGQLMYCIRLESELPLQDKFIAYNKVISNIAGYVEAIIFDREFALCHEKEEYLNINNHLQEKIESGDFKVIDEHLHISI